VIRKTPPKKKKSPPSLAERAASTPPGRRELGELAQYLAGYAPVVISELALRAADEHRDRAFTHLVFGGLAAGHPVDASLIAAGAGLLPDLETLAALCGRATGEVGEALLEAVRSHRLGWDREPGALLLCELWSRRAGQSRPPGLVSLARIRARREATEEGEDALVALHGLLEDPDFSAMIEPSLTPELKEAARQRTTRLVEAMLGEPLAVFPERAQRKTRSARPVRRAAARVGRNDLCPCGSGKKYKQCHEGPDRERLADSSDVEGLTEGELGAELERHLSLERLGELRGYELARLDPEQIPAELRQPWLEQLGLWGEHEEAVQAVERWSKRREQAGLSEEQLDALVVGVAELAARDGQLPLVRKLVKLRSGTEGMLLDTLLLLLPKTQRLATLEQMALDELDVHGVDLSFALFQLGLPALGIHVARAQLVLRATDPETEALHATLLEKRDELLLPPWDPVEDVLYTLDHGVAPAVERELLTARARLDHGDQALRSAQEALDAVKAELARREEEAKRAPSVQAPQPSLPQHSHPQHSHPQHRDPLDDGAVRELRERVEQLKGELNERHRERNALRRELEEARAEMAELQEAPEDDEEGGPDKEEDDDAGEALDAAVAARVRVPRFPEDFAATLRKVPDATARAAMARVGELCAGYDIAFREVRPLRGFDGVWRVKVGRSYRLLFRPHEDTLEVLELLHRQDLEKRLFRLRRSGEA
jgi:hypothetical protein